MILRSEAIGLQVLQVVVLRQDDQIPDGDGLFVD